MVELQKRETLFDCSDGATYDGAGLPDGSMRRLIDDDGSYAGSFSQKAGWNHRLLLDVDCQP